MKHIFCVMFCLMTVACSAAKPVPVHFFKADNPNIKYVGRVDFTNPGLPRFWSPGVYVRAKFVGTSLEIFVNDEELYGKTHNYIEIAIDDQKPFRIQTTGKTNAIKVAQHLKPGVHQVVICKDTESGIGYLEFVGLKCERLLPVVLSKRKIEFIGDSMTCGTGSDLSVVPCDKGQWYDQHNAYMSYGPATARKVNAEWQLTAVSGIGMIYSCCNIGITMPQVFDKVMLRDNVGLWDFKRFTPDVVTICLGQNDGKQDSVAFCSAYVSFIKTVRMHYPKADIVCLNSPMANSELAPVLRRYIFAIVASVNDTKVSYYFFDKSYNDGCGGHPGMAQHQLMAVGLAGYLVGLEKW